MTNQLMNSGRTAFAQAGINWNSDTISAVLVDNTYTFSASHANLSDVSVSARIATTNLSGKSSTNGVLDATSPITWSSVTSPNPIIGVYIYKNTGTAGTSTLILWIDEVIEVTIASATSSSTSVPVDRLNSDVPNGATLTRISGSGPSTITLSGGGGGSENARTLTSASSISCVANDVYTVSTGKGLPIGTNPNGGTVSLSIDSTDKLAQI